MHPVRMRRIERTMLHCVNKLRSETGILCWSGNRGRHALGKARGQTARTSCSERAWPLARLPHCTLDVSGSMSIGRHVDRRDRATKLILLPGRRLQRNIFSFSSDDEVTKPNAAPVVDSLALLGGPRSRWASVEKTHSWRSFRRG